MSAEPRTYVVGLPVIVTVTADGEVLYDIDTSETSLAIFDANDEQASPVSDEQITLDMIACNADHDRRHGTDA